MHPRLVKPCEVAGVGLVVVIMSLMMAGIVYVSCELLCVFERIEP